MRRYPFVFAPHPCLSRFHGARYFHIDFLIVDLKFYVRRTKELTVDTFMSCKSDLVDRTYDKYKGEWSKHIQSTICPSESNCESCRSLLSASSSDDADLMSWFLQNTGLTHREFKKKLTWRWGTLDGCHNDVPQPSLFKTNNGKAGFQPSDEASSSISSVLFLTEFIAFHRTQIGRHFGTRQVKKVWKFESLKEHFVGLQGKNGKGRAVGADAQDIMDELVVRKRKRKEAENRKAAKQNKRRAKEDPPYKNAKLY